MPPNLPDIDFESGDGSQKRAAFEVRRVLGRARRDAWGGGLAKAEMKRRTGLAYNTVKKYLRRLKEDEQS